MPKAKETGIQSRLDDGKLEIRINKSDVEKALAHHVKDMFVGQWGVEIKHIHQNGEVTVMAERTDSEVRPNVETLAAAGTRPLQGVSMSALDAERELDDMTGGDEGMKELE